MRILFRKFDDIFKVLTTCACCGKFPAHRRRQKTSYHDDEANFDTLCDQCQSEADTYWQERWNEYYQGVL